MSSPSVGDDYVPLKRGSADGSGIDWTERPMPNTYAAPVFEPMTPYAEQAEQARTRCKVIHEQLSTLFKMAEGGLTLGIISDTNNAKERLRLASALADSLDTLARVEAIINTPLKFGARDTLDGVIKALEGK